MTRRPRVPADQTAPGPLQSQRPSVTLGGKTYRLRFDYAALCELGDMLGVTLANLSESLGTLRMSQSHFPLWAALLEERPDLTPEDVKAELSALTLRESVAAIGRGTDAMKAAMAEGATTAGEGEGDPPPPVATGNDAAP